MTPPGPSSVKNSAPVMRLMTTSSSRPEPTMSKSRPSVSPSRRAARTTPAGTGVQSQQAVGTVRTRKCRHGDLIGIQSATGEA